MINKKVVLAAIFMTVVAVSLFVFFKDDVTAPHNQAANQTDNADNVKNEQFNKELYSLTEPESLWVIVNKKNGLKPADYQPADLVEPKVPLRVPGHQTMLLRKQAASALEQMFTKASKDGLNLMLASGHRDYAYQKSLYNTYVAQSGREAADTFSARPGHSEHQTGLAADVEPASRKCETEVCFADTSEGQWVAKNAHKFGFIIRYPKGKDSVTGYTYEPWHLRYVGLELAAEMNKQSVATLEEFFGIPGGTEY